jgi:16S rRNA (cytidine1402-2'-O)-methyltransferase
MSYLYVIATPIGNLQDLTFRARRVLGEADLILAEDTRVIKKLLNRFGIKKPVLSYHQHSSLKKTSYIISLLKQGKNLALVSDSGTPGISDPGGKLVKEVVKELNGKVKVVPLPGPSALTAAASVAGISMDKFLFLGFPPAKKKRNKFFQEVSSCKYPVIIYESPHRILKTLKELPQEREIIVCKELSKMHEEIFRGKPGEILKRLPKDKVKGEFVVIVSPK